MKKKQYKSLSKKVNYSHNLHAYLYYTCIIIDSQMDQQIWRMWKTSSKFGFDVFAKAEREKTTNSLDWYAREILLLHACNHV